MRTTVVVPSWNGRGLLGRALASIAAQTDRDLQVVVVDDGSTDGTAEYLAAEWPDVKVIRQPENRGFAAAVNRGIAEGDAELVALVNNDVELHPEWLEWSVDALEHHPEAGSVATKLVDGHRPGHLDGAGDVLGWDGYAVRHGRGHPDDGGFDEPGPVLSACAAAALYRRAALEDVGGFDERFFAYLEDVDWGLRAQLAGWRCWYEPAAVAVHSAGSTSGTITGFELYHAHRNMIWLMAKSFPLWALLAFAPLAIARRLGSLIKAARAGAAGTVLRAWRDGLRSAPAILAERRARRNARAGWREVRPLMRIWAR